MSEIPTPGRPFAAPTGVGGDPANLQAAIHPTGLTVSEHVQITDGLGDHYLVFETRRGGMGMRLHDVATHTADEAMPVRPGTVLDEP